MRFFVDVATSPGAVELAAAEWDTELAEFPKRA